MPPVPAPFDIPGDEPQFRGQHDGGRLAQHGQRSEEKRRQVGSACCCRVAVLGEVKRLGEVKNGEQVEKAGLSVLELGDPGHRFNLHRMHRPERGTQPRARNFERAQHTPQRHRTRSLHGDVDKVKRRRGQAPKLVLQPERGEHQRIVARLARRPDFLQAVGADDARIGGDVVVIVPDEAPVPRRQKSHEDGEDEKQSPEPVPLQQGCKIAISRRPRAAQGAGFPCGNRHFPGGL